MMDGVRETFANFIIASETGDGAEDESAGAEEALRNGGSLG